MSVRNRGHRASTWTGSSWSRSEMVTKKRFSSGSAAMSPARPVHSVTTPPVSLSSKNSSCWMASSTRSTNPATRSIAFRPPLRWTPESLGAQRHQWINTRALRASRWPAGEGDEHPAVPRRRPNRSGARVTRVSAIGASQPPSSCCQRRRSLNTATSADPERGPFPTSALSRA